MTNGSPLPANVGTTRKRKSSTRNRALTKLFVITLLFASTRAFAQVPTPRESTMGAKMGGSVGVIEDPSLFVIGFDWDSARRGTTYLSFLSDFGFASKAVRMLGGIGIKHKFVIRSTTLVTPYVRALFSFGFLIHKEKPFAEIAPRGGGGIRFNPTRALGIGLEFLFGIGGRFGEKSGALASVDVAFVFEFRI